MRRDRTEAGVRAGTVPGADATDPEAIADMTLLAMPNASPLLTTLAAAALDGSDRQTFLDTVLDALRGPAPAQTGCVMLLGGRPALSVAAGTNPCRSLRAFARRCMMTGLMGEIVGRAGSACGPAPWCCLPLPGRQPATGVVIVAAAAVAAMTPEEVALGPALVALGLRVREGGAPADPGRHGGSADDPYRRALNEHAIVAVTDPAGRIVEVNERFCEISGYARHELIGRSHRVVNSGTHAREFFKRLWDTIRSGRTWHGVICNRTKTGRLYWVETTIVPILDAAGRIVRYVSIRVDISAHKHALQALEEVTDRLAGYAEMARLGGWSYDAATGSIQWDRICAEIHGTPGTFEPTLESCVALYRPEAGAAMQAAIARTLADGGSFDIELSMVAPSGRRIWVRMIGRADRLDGQITGISGTYQDITEAHEREQAIGRLRARFEAIFDKTDALIFIKNRAGKIQVANPSYLAAGRFDSVAGMTDADLYTPETAAMLQAVDCAVFETGQPFTGEETVRFASGRTIIYLSSKFLIHDPVADEDLLCGIATDITAQKQLQQSLEEARRHAEAANEAKSRFLATMSHEIRTPMNGVLGMAEVLEAKVSDPEHRHLLGVIRRSGETLIGLLNDILDLSKIEAGRIEVERVPFSLPEIAQQVEAVHAGRAAERGLTLAVLMGTGTGEPRLGDPHRVRQILHNLVNNAIKFTESGEVSVVLRADGTAGVVIEVRDTGIGMTAQQLARVFDEFAQADTTTTRRYGGTGLGLAIVRGLAEAMGGRIDVDSKPGRGTRFRVSLPLPVAQEVAPDTTEPEDRPALDTALKVLAADDNEVNRLVLGAMLHNLGADVTIVDGAHAAIEARFAGEPDVILLDISMPEMDGMETLAAIRAREAALGLRAVPAIAVTANAMAHQVETYLGAGFAAHVAKPIRLDDLRATLAAQARRA